MPFKLYQMKKHLYGLCLFLGVAGVQAQTGIGTNTPNSTLDVRGAMAAGFRAFSSATSLSSTDHVAVFTGLTDATVTLPDATTCTGRIYWIKNASTTLPTPVLTVNTVSSQTIEGSATTQLDEPDEIVRLISDGSNWEISSQGTPNPKTSTTGGPWNEGGNSVKSRKAVGTTSSTDIAFITNNTEAMRVSSQGYIGFNTTNPQGRLHVTSVNDDAGNDYWLHDYLNGTGVTQMIYLRKSAGTVASPTNLQNGDTIAQVRFAPRYGGALNRTTGSGIDAVYKGDGTTQLTDLRMFASNSETMRINENGKVSIGTTTPDGVNPEKLLVDAGTTGSYNVISGKGSIDNYLQLNIQNKSNGSVASSDVVASADNGDESNNYIDMGINSSGYSVGSSFILNAVNQPYLYAAGNDFVIGNGSPSYDLIFFTNGYTASSERMRITAAGNVGIGQVTSPSEKLVVAGIVSPGTDNSYTLGTSTNRWSSVWSANGVVQTSDLRMKTNIQPLTYGVSQLMALHPVTYNWKKDPAGTKQLGLIAQETQEVIPEVVHGHAATENLGMNYAELVAVLVHSLQQQQQKLKELRLQLQELTKESHHE